MAHKIRGDVEWRIPTQKKPIAYSTKATSDLIVVLSKDGGTISEVRKAITYDVEAKAVLDEYIKRGYGNQIAKGWFK